MANYPTSQDDSSSLPNPTGTSTQASPDHANLHTAENSAIIALESKLGTGASTPTNNFFLVGTGAGTSAWTKAVPTGAVLGTTDTQNVSNKTFTASTWTGGTISNPVLNVDTITGFTVSGNGTVYGLGINSGVLQTANAVTDTAIASGALRANKFSNPYKFSAVQSTAQSSIGTADTLLTFGGTKDYDTSSNFSTSTSLFTAPIAGFYHFSGFVQVVLGASTTSAYTSIYKNGSLYRRVSYIQASNINSGHMLSIDIQLTANDAIGWYCGSTGAAVSTNSTSVPATFAGHLVSAT